MTTTLVLTHNIASRLHELASLDVESAAVLLIRPVVVPGGAMRLLSRRLAEVPDGAYVRRERESLLITSDGYVPALGEAASTGCIPIWLHTHPGSGASPLPSVHDVKVDEQLSDLFRLRGESNHYGSVIVSIDGDRLTFTGYLDDGAAKRQVDRLVVVGERLALQLQYKTELAPIPELFDRNIRAFGGGVQRVLGDLRIAVVGCGGTGSAVAEQLIRLGVRHLTLVDPDALTQSNITRVYGSTPEDVGQPKVDVLGDHLLRIAPDACIKRIPTMLTVERTARSLAGVDLIFGCTDDNAGRLVLSRMATFLLIPIIDCGVILTTDSSGKLDGIHGRVTVLYPGAACLVCRNRIDTARAHSEMLTPTERNRLIEEGYAPALPGTEPAVVTFTTSVAAAAVAELLERLTSYGPEPVPTEVILRLHDREVSTNVQAPRERHYCHPTADKLGLGDVTPFLEQTWQA